MNFKSVIFDLDGTITDSASGIINSVQYALKKMGIIEKNKDSLMAFVGPPLHESFQSYYNMSEKDSFIAVDYYREYYSERGIFENILYDGIVELLEDLFPIPLYIATSKPLFYAEKIIKHFDLSKFFTFIAGSNMDGTRTDKKDIIRFLLTEKRVSYPVMVGDRKHDIIGAQKNGLHSAGVLYGYGTEEELKEAEADFIISNVSSLSDFLMKNTSAT